ncbi:hypothetical protein ACC720_39030, partial [Rhizobium ruizarguesonis]
ISSLHRVTNVETVGMWDSKATSLTLPASVLPRPQLEGCAILLQSAPADGDPAALLGATVVMAGENI